MRCLSRLCRRSLPALAALALAGSAAAQEMYRWVDAQGRTHFGSAPPPGAQHLERVAPEPASGSVTVVPGASSAREGPPRAAERDPVARGRARQSDAAQRLRQLEDQEPTSIAGKSETQWRSSMVALENAVKSAKERLEQAEYDLSNAYSLGDSAYYQRRVDRYKTKLKAAEEAQGRFEDEARELGVPPGWLR